MSRQGVALTLVVFAVVVLSAVLGTHAGRPVVLWHGMGDTCCYSFSMGRIQKMIQTQVPDTYVYSVEIGGSMVADEIEGFLSNVNDQVDFVCDKVKNDPKLQGGFNAIGFSQGSQFLRAYVERCNDPPVYNLISIGGQHQGVADIPNCVTPNTTICTIVNEVLGFGVYNYFVQRSIVQAQYFKDPLQYDSYLANNIFLPDINNEKAAKNPLYKKHLTSLNKFVLVKFLRDSMVVPRESEWFGEFAKGSLSTIVPMNETDLYKQDWIGLKTLDQNGKLVFLSVDGDHLRFTDQWFQQNIIAPYLAAN
ncbi:Palmitoyl-protein thioesterase 1 [Balamuthia mandrillaris]